MFCIAIHWWRWLYSHRNVWITVKMWASVYQRIMTDLPSHSGLYKRNKMSYSGAISIHDLIVTWTVYLVFIAYETIWLQYTCSTSIMVLFRYTPIAIWWHKNCSSCTPIWTPMQWYNGKYCCLFLLQFKQWRKEGYLPLHSQTTVGLYHCAGRPCRKIPLLIGSTG